MGFLTGINLLGAALGFAIGGMGYIIVQYWIRPVSRYGRRKRRAAAAVADHLSLLETGDAGDQAGNRIAESRRRLRVLAGEMTDAFHQELPNWYRIRLRARGEDVPAAAGLLMKLSGIREPAPARRRADEIRKTLCLQGKSR